jgi:peptide/nickel transport system ATP-binding protein
MIFQEPMSSLNPVFTVGFQIGEVLRLHLGMDKRQARARTLELLEEVGIPDPAARSTPIRARCRAASSSA